MKLATQQNAVLLFLRIAIAAIFIHASYIKFGMWNMQASAEMSENMLLLTKFLAVVEGLGGLAVLIGFLTRWAALGLSIIMVGAIGMMQFGMGIGFASMQGPGWNFDLIILAGSLMLAVYGPGAWGLKK